MFHERARNLQGLSLFLDAFCICLAFTSAFFLRIVHDGIPLLQRIPSHPWVAERAVRSDYAILVLVNVLVWLFYLRRSRIYIDGSAERMEGVLPVYIKAFLLALLATGGVGFALKLLISRLFFAYFFAGMFGFLVTKQALVVLALRSMRITGSRRRNALVIGAGRPATWFAKVVSQAGHTGYHLVGLLHTDDRCAEPATGVPTVGRVGDLDRVLETHAVDEVFLVGAAREIAEMAPVAQALIEKGRTVSIVSALNHSDRGVRGRITNFSGVPMISFGAMPRDQVRLGIKRLIDVALSATALILISPLMLLIAASIRIFDRGPVFFAQQRLGKDGTLFRLYKFRSMRVDAEQLLRSDAGLHQRYLDNDYKLPLDSDPRISSLGRFLRRYSLDELPQFWNVLRGDMTLVGPRPIVPCEIEKYEPYAGLFLSVRPGMTGHWQIAGRSDIAYPERAFLDLDYAGSHSVADDLSIILRTVPAVLRKRGAH